MNAGTTEYVIEAETRSDMGKGASRRLRHQGKIPGVIYGAGKDAVSITLDHNKLNHQLDHESFYSSVLKIKVDGGKTEDVLLKDLQRHAFKPKLVHVDFHRVRADVAIKVSVPVHVEGAEENAAVKAGGVVSHMLTEVEVSCLPANLPESLSLDITELEMDGHLSLSDMKMPKGVEVVALAQEEPNNMSVVAIHVPKEVPDEEPEVQLADGEEASAEGGDDAAEGDKPAEDADKSEGE